MVMLFSALKLIPGDPATIMLGARASAAMKARITEELGLNDSIPVQLATFFSRILQGNLGTDMWSQRPVSQMVLENLPYTLTLIAVGLGWAAAIGIPLGCYSAIRRNSFIDKFTGVLSVATISIPSFVVAIYVILLFAIKLDWLPVIGAGERGDVADQVAHLVMPGFALGLGWVGYLSRIVRASMLEIMGENHIRTARAFGLPESRSSYDRTRCRIAILPTITLLAVAIGGLLSSAVFVEVDFRPPGHRQAHRRCGEHAQLSGGPGRRPVGGCPVCPDHAHGRSAGRLARSPCPFSPLTSRSSPHPAPASQLLRRIGGDPLGLLGLILVLIVVICGLFAPWVAPFDPFKISVPDRLQPPTLLHWFGTDNLGRDIFSRVIMGSRIALSVGISTIGMALCLGLLLGLLAGYGPRWLDNFLMLVFDSIYSFPVVMLGLTVATLLGASIATLMLVVMVVQTPAYGRLTRTATLSIKNSEYVQAVRSLGASPWRIIGVHILPNVVGPLLIIASMDIPSVVALEAGLTYLGMGIPPPAPSWGRILQEGYVLIREAPWIVVAGGIPLIITTLGFTFLGESLRDLLDPRLRRVV